MAYQQTEDKVKTKQERTKFAITLAMQNRWSEAVAVNRSLIDDFPGDLESYNRMGRALTELGRIDEAREAFRRVLEVSPHNTIAIRKNLDRLDQLGRQPAPSPADEPPGHAGLHRRVRQDARDVARERRAAQDTRETHTGRRRELGAWPDGG